MAVPANPSLSQVYAEFGAPAGTPLSAFLRGGAWVPHVPANAGVPTALPISLSQLAGAVKNVYTPVSISGPSTASGTTELEAPGPFTALVVSDPNTLMVASGGNGSYTYTWSHVSGDASIAVNTFSGGASAQFSATVNRNNYKSAVKRCTVSDGVTSASKDVTVNLSYTTF